MHALIAMVVVVGIIALTAVALALQIVYQYERGVVFRFGRVVGEKAPGLVVILPIVNVIRKVSLRTRSRKG